MHIYKDQCIGTALFRGKCDPQNYNKIKKKKIVFYGTSNLLVPHIIMFITWRYPMGVVMIATILYKK